MFSGIIRALKWYGRAVFAAVIAEPGRNSLLAALGIGTGVVAGGVAGGMAGSMVNRSATDPPHDTSWIDDAFDGKTKYPTPNNGTSTKPKQIPPAPVSRKDIVGRWESTGFLPTEDHYDSDAEPNFRLFRMTEWTFLPDGSFTAIMSPPKSVSPEQTTLLFAYGVWLFGEPDDLVLKFHYFGWKKFTGSMSRLSRLRGDQPSEKAYPFQEGEIYELEWKVMYANGAVLMALLPPSLDGNDEWAYWVFKQVGN